MKSRKPFLEQCDLLRAGLVEVIDMRHELLNLAALIAWELFERDWAGLFPSSVGRPATPPRSSIFSMPADCPIKPTWPAGPRIYW